MPFSLLKLIMHGNCAVKAKVAQTHCTGINRMKKAKKEKKTPHSFIKCLCAHAGAPGNKNKDLENSDINKKKFDSVASIELSGDLQYFRVKPHYFNLNIAVKFCINKNFDE